MPLLPPPSALALLGLVVWAPPALARPSDPKAPALTVDSVNGATFSVLPEPPAKVPSSTVLKAAILLDRARFSPGAIDGIDGDNFRKAVGAYQKQMGLGASGVLDQATWDKLTGSDGGVVLVTRPVTPADLKGPFAKRIPAKFEAQAKLKRLAYTDVQEELSEQYHVSRGLLIALNKGQSWKGPGRTIVVPQVVADRPAADVARITVDKASHAVEAFAPDGKLVAYYPASIGSDEKPAPSGQFVIRRVIHNPDYTYNPKYAFKGVKATKPFTIAPGPNNPVGSVWLDLSDEGYGIHGTPQPELVGKTQSHGCIRLTNWAVEDLASLVRAGTPVSFEDAAPAQAPAQPSPTPTVPAPTPEQAPAPAVPEGGSSPAAPPKP